MRANHLFIILKKFILIIIFFFLLFIIYINLIKLVIFNIKVKRVLNILNNKTKTFNNINKNKSNEVVNYFEANEAFTASKLGFVNSIYNINNTEWNEGINILLIGSDKENFSFEKARSDIIILLRIINNGKILSISIPRDSLITISEGEWAGYSDKIGHSLYWGGVDNLKKNVENLIQSPIYRIAIVDNFKNFEAFLAVMGGIKIDKKLIGNTGIQWIRNRNFKDGDIERCKRQQVFLKHSVIKMWKITNKGNFFYANYFYNFLKRIIYTDLSNEDINNILYILKKNKFNPKTDFLTSILPGNFGKYDSILLNRSQLDCWLLNRDIINKIRILFYSESDYKLKKYRINYLSFMKISLSNVYKNIFKKIKY